MGYEVKVLIGKKYDNMPENNADYFSFDISFDLGALSRSFIDNLIDNIKIKKDIHDIYCYIENQDKYTTRDKYGRKLVAIPLNYVLRVIRRINKEDKEKKQSYWKLQLLQKILQETKKADSNWYVVLYGF